MKRKLFYLFLIIIFVSLIDIIALISIKETAFPFITMSYVYTEDDFNFIGFNYDLPLSDDFKKRVSNDLSPILEGRRDDVFFVSSVLAQYVRDNLFNQSNAIDNVDEILQSQKEYPAICSGYAKFLVSLAQSLGYEARVLWLSNHTVSEIYFPDYGWVLVDTNGNLVFQNKKEQYSNLLYVIENFEEVIPKRLASQTNNDPDYFSKQDYSVYQKKDIIVVIEGPRLFDFFIRTKEPSVLVNYLLGKEDVAQGIQYVGQGREKLGNFKYSLISLIIFNLSFLIVFIYYLSLIFWCLKNMNRVKYFSPQRIVNKKASPDRNYLDRFFYENIQKIIPQKEIEVLDIGCGSGYIREIFYNLGYKLIYTGLDIEKNKRFDEFNKYGFSSKFIKSKIEDFKTDKKFDLIISLASLEHIEDDKKAASKSFQFLKPSGVQIHAVPTNSAFFLYLWHGYRQYSPSKLKNLFGDNIEIYKLGGFFSFILHFFFITIPKRVFKTDKLMETRAFFKLLRISNKLDRFFPVLSSVYVLVLSRKNHD